MEFLHYFNIINNIAKELSISLPLHKALDIIFSNLKDIPEISGISYYNITPQGTLQLEEQIGLQKITNKKEFFSIDSPEMNLALNKASSYIIYPVEHDYFNLIKSFKYSPSWILTSPVILNEDNIGLFLIIGNNNTDKKEIITLLAENISFKIGGIIGRIEYESQINERQQCLNTLLNNLHDILLITNTDGIIIYFNTTLCNKTGYLEDEIYQLNIIHFFPEELAFDIKNLMNTLQINESKLLLFPILNSRKEIIPCETIVSKNLWNDQTIISWNIRDLKDRQEAQEQILKAKQNAEIANEAKTKFLTNLSFSLRIPLSSILGMTELLLKTDLQKTQFNYVNIITRSAEQLMQITNQLLDVSLIERGELKLEYKTFSLKDIIIQVINQQYYKAFNKGLEIICDYIYYGQDIILRGDALRLTQVLQNLIENAVKYTHKGKIEIQITPENVENHDISIYFSIKDTGIGIDETTIKNIYEACEQKKPIGQANQGELGLGLIIAYNLIELMGGKLNIYSEPNKGTEMSFVLTFPIAPIYELEHKEEAKPFNHYQDKEIKILVAEDQAFNQMVIKNMLEDFGFIVDCVDNGQQLIEKLQNNMYDVIITDIYMPVMDGIAATLYIRKNFDKPICNIPIIGITANAYINEHQKFIEAGMNDTISKPFKSHLLYSKVIHAIGLSKYNKSQFDNRFIKFDVIETPKEKFYDLELIKNIAKNQNSAIIKMLQVFIEKTNIELQQLENYVSQNDWENIADLTHKMRPSLSYLSMKLAEEIVQNIHLSAKNKENLDTIPKQVNNLKSLLLYIITLIQEEITKLHK